MAGPVAEEHELEREKDDLYETPADATRAFVHAEGHRLRQFSSLWEPAAGNGEIVSVLQSAGFEVIASDLRDRGNSYEVGDFF